MIGLLWFDESGTLEQRVERAVRRYTEKFGRRPTVCYVHPSMLNDGPVLVAGVRVVPRRATLRDHFFVGVEDEDTGNRGQLPRPAPDAGGDVLDKTRPNQKWMQPGLSIVESVPGGYQEL